MHTEGDDFVTEQISYIVSLPGNMSQKCRQIMSLCTFHSLGWGESMISRLSCKRNDNREKEIVHCFVIKPLPRFIQNTIKLFQPKLYSHVMFT